MDSYTEDPTLPLHRKIAIVGIGCRYANEINKVEDFVRMLRQGMDCTSEPPAGRYDMKHLYRPGKSPGKMYNQRGGYIRQDLEAFDRQFFKMPPEEANALDPQVRLLLETTWEGLEDAGIPASRLKGSNTGVYMGVTANEYNSLTTYPYENISQYTNSGTNSCMVANRISYELDLHGPSFSVDTACSSSLYTIHLACEALRHGDCDAAIAGGVNLLLSPVTHIGFCQAGMLAPDGRCKSFDNAADGYSRSEGAGVVILKPLQKALEDGDNIYAVIRGGALSNDGHTPGIANPSYEAQVDLVHRACKHANVNPHKIEYIEAHGTGTKVGDKTEANALGEALGKERDGNIDPSLYIGSVKSNFGHTEGAAGVAGIIKVAVMQRYNFIPPVVNFKKGNENIAFNELKLKVPTCVVDWPRPKDGIKRLAGCSSFGFGGANAHMILEEPPARPMIPLLKEGNYDTKTILFMSAATKEALEVRKKQMVTFMNQIAEGKKTDSTRFQDVAASSYHRAHHHRNRLALVASTTEEAKNKLDAMIAGEKVEGLVDGSASEITNLSGIVFVFTGMGSQWWAMGNKLLKESEIFQTTLQKFDKVLKSLGAEWSMVELLSQAADKDKVNQTEYAQPAICAVEMGLVELLLHYGVKPDAIVGQSMGEVAAAFASRMLSFENAVKIIYYRGKELMKTSGSGKMLAVLHPYNDVIAKLQAYGFEDVIDISAWNSPTQVVLSGESSAVEKFAVKMKEDGIRAVMLKVNNAFHSYQQEVLKESLLQKFSFLKDRVYDCEEDDVINMVSSVTGDYVSQSQLNDPNYWWSNVRQKVSFVPAVEKLLKQGFTTFVEIGPHPALNPAIMDIIRAQPEQPSKVLVMGTLKRPKDTSKPGDDVTEFMAALGKLHCEGYPIDLQHLYPKSYNVITLPLYPWQKVECSAMTKESKELILFPRKHHNILGQKEDPSPAKPKNVKIWNSELTIETVPWILDHVIQDSIIAPGTSYLETALQAARELHGDLPLIISDIELKRFLFMPDCKATLQIVVEEKDETTLFTIYSKGGRQTWSMHATGKIVPPVEQSDLPHFDVEEVKEKLSGPEAHDTDFLYSKFSCMGYALGTSFQGLKKAWFSEDLSICYSKVEATEDIKKERDMYNFHPAMMDALMQGFGNTFVLQQEKQAEKLKTKVKVNLYVPLRVKKIQFLNAIPDTVYVRTQVSEVNGEMHANIDVADSEGTLVYRMVGLVFGRASDTEDGSDLQLWTFHWDRVHLPEKEHKDSQEIENYSQESPSVVDILMICQDKATGENIKQQVQNGMKVAVESYKYGKEQILNKYTNVQHVLFLAMNTSLPNGEDLCKKEQFKTLVEETCILASKIGKEISDIPEIKPTFWIVTRGAHVIGDDGPSNPMAHATQALAIALMNEIPDVHTKMIDLPVKKEQYKACLPTLRVLLQHPIDSENELCIRTSDDDETVKIFGRRLQHRPHQNISHPISNCKWAIKQDTKSSGLTVVPMNPQEDSCAEDEICISQVKSFKLLQKSTGFNAIVAGTVNLGGDEIENVVGFTNSNVQATMKVKKIFSGRIPNGMTHIIAVSIIDTYLLPYVASQTIDFTNLDVAISGKQEMECSAYQQTLESVAGQVTIISNISDINDQYDALVLVVDKSLKSAEIKAMIKRLKPFGKILMVTDGDETYGDIMQTMLQSKFVSLIQMSRTIDAKDPVAGKLSKFIPEVLMQVHNVDNIGDRVVSLNSIESISKPLDIVEIHDSKIFANMEVKNNSFKANSEATYVVTGASKGFGLELLQWLHNSGAQHIVVFSRSQPHGEDMEKHAIMKKEGIHITWKAVDITNVDQVENAFNELKESHPPIEGIIHCAAVYRDGWLNGLKEQDWLDVMMPKAYGAYILHQISIKLELPLKYFVLFSSVVNLIGSAGQSNYCSANGFLYALGEMRQSMGLPATVASFGIINTVGFAARNALVETWEEKGLSSVTPSTALNTLGMMLNLDIFHLGITGFFEPKMYYLHNRPQLNEHLQNPEGCYSRWKLVFKKDLLQQNKKGLEQKIMEETPATAKVMIHQELAAFLAERLGIADPESITVDNSPTSYGLDSLMSSDMSNHISEKFQTSVLPVELLNDKNTVGKLVNSIYEKILAKANSNIDSSQYDIINVAKPDFLIKEEAIENPRAIVVCFPPNGGGISTYYGWQEKFKEKNIQVYTVQLPAWEGREKEEPLSSLDDIIPVLADAIAPIVRGKQFTFYGHSFGSLLAYEVSHQLKEKYGVHPSHLFLGAWYGPTVAYVRPEEAVPKIFDPETPIEEAIKQARCFRFLDEDVLNNVNLMKRMLPCIKVSLDMCEQYKHQHTDKLPTSLHVYAGSRDTFLPMMTIEDWNKVQHPNHSFNLKVLEGGKHLFILDKINREHIISDIVKFLNL